MPHFIAKINTLLLRKFIQEMRPPDKRLSKKSFHFQLASPEVSYQLSGFEYNAVTPFGFSGPNLPTIVCSRCLAVCPSLLFLGGGEVDMKIAIPTSTLVQSRCAIVGLVTDMRADYHSADKDDIE